MPILRERKRHRNGPLFRLPSRRRGNVRFLWEFIKHPRTVASILPSSRFLERHVVERARVAEARLVVELGPGTGGTTRAILAALPADARLLSIENNRRFHRLLERIDDGRHLAHLGCATELAEILGRHGLEAPDAVISGIPFSKLDPPAGRAVITAVSEVLRPGGCFVAYQVRGDVAQLCRPHLGTEQSKRTILFNVPPLRVYRWEKANGRRRG